MGSGNLSKTGVTLKAGSSRWAPRELLFGIVGPRSRAAIFFFSSDAGTRSFFPSSSTRTALPISPRASHPSRLSTTAIQYKNHNDQRLSDRAGMATTRLTLLGKDPDRWFHLGIHGLPVELPVQKWALPRIRQALELASFGNFSSKLSPPRLCP
jgi:hypothetical protein